jgi:hypothetical protein
MRASGSGARYASLGIRNDGLGAVINREINVIAAPQIAHGTDVALSHAG